ncbi:peptide deformylase [Patescibacteria group bacterium]|nr:peptide deformylase [Patescibacteria group bacterium]
MVTIVQKGSLILRKVAKEVPQNEISSKKIQKLIREMSEVLARQEDGIALAAPQVSKSIRLFIISGKALKEERVTKENPEKNLIFINPIIVKRSNKKNIIDEGCLSVRGVYGKVKRAEKVTLCAYDENGKKIEHGGSGLIAQIFQHEIDHLDGILFIDKTSDTWDIPVTHEKKS